jgi:hypothetical protein
MPRRAIVCPVLRHGRPSLWAESSRITVAECCACPIWITAALETGLEVRVPLFIKEGEKVKVSTESREFAGRA